jgi:type IV pilus assembly protein PilQ
MLHGSNLPKSMLSILQHIRKPPFVQHVRLSRYTIACLLLALSFSPGCRKDHLAGRLIAGHKSSGEDLQQDRLPLPASAHGPTSSSRRVERKPGDAIAETNSPPAWLARQHSASPLPSLPDDFDITLSGNTTAALTLPTSPPNVASFGQAVSLPPPASTMPSLPSMTYDDFVGQITDFPEKSSSPFRLASVVTEPAQAIDPSRMTQESKATVSEQLPDEQPSSTKQLFQFPLQSEISGKEIQISSSQELMTLTAHEAPLNKLLALIAEQHRLNIISGADVSEPISVSISNVPLEEALDAILITNGYAWTRQKNIVIVSKIAADRKTSAGAQGRAVQVFSLNYVATEDVDKVVKGLLSPVGQSFISKSAIADHRRAHEQLIVEDLPEYLTRIGNYLLQVDTPPRQVLIEAHVLQVTLKDNCRHGINLQNLARIANTDVTLSTTGMAAGLAPTSSLRIDGSRLDGILEAIKATTDSKTLASPKVAVLNNQEATMQVGSKIGYLLTTTTQTSTLQSVSFLDVGVILKVMPSITDDGQVLIQVNPQVSTGRINPTTELPESETTEVRSSVLLADGEAIVIGGLIKETDNDSRNKVPFLGDLWLIGGLFQRRETTRERNEIIITILPRIIPDVACCRNIEPDLVEQAHTRLLYGDLQSMDRTAFEPQLPSYTKLPRDRRFYCPPGTTPVPAGTATNLVPTVSTRIFLNHEPRSTNNDLVPSGPIEPEHYSKSTGSYQSDIPQQQPTPR